MISIALVSYQLVRGTRSQGRMVVFLKVCTTCLQVHSVLERNLVKGEFNLYFISAEVQRVEFMENGV